jgi:hypothetical protein
VGILNHIGFLKNNGGRADPAGNDGQSLPHHQRVAEVGVNVVPTRPEASLDRLEVLTGDVEPVLGGGELDFEVDEVRVMGSLYAYRVQMSIAA